MKLIILFGPPAAGKHTIGLELQKLINYKFFHNHLVVDATLSLFEFGSPSFIKMREKLWLDLLEEAASIKTEGVIFTFNPESTVRLNFIDDLKAKLTAKNVEFFFIKITCPEDIIENRMDSPSRHSFKKLTSLPLYRELRKANVFKDDWMSAPHYSVDSAEHTPQESALLIKKFCKL